MTSQIFVMTIQISINKYFSKLLYWHIICTLHFIQQAIMFICLNDTIIFIVDDCTVIFGWMNSRT